jgi:hypothetical protein
MEAVENETEGPVKKRTLLTHSEAKEGNLVRVVAGLLTQAAEIPEGFRPAPGRPAARTGEQARLPTVPDIRPAGYSGWGIND